MDIIKIKRKLKILQELAGWAVSAKFDELYSTKALDRWRFYDRGVSKQVLIEANIFWKEVYKEWKEHTLFVRGSLFEKNEYKHLKIYDLIKKLRKGAKR